jgi:hypothetical protein
MKPRSNIGYYSLFTVFGAVLACTVLVVVLRFHAGGRLDEESVARVKAVQLVDQMRLDLALASQKEWNAIMAESDQDSRAYADQARSAAARVEEGARELQAVMEPYFTRDQKDLAVQFSQALDEYRKVDASLLDLAVQHSNAKAYALAFGPAAASVQEMTDALDRLTGRHADKPLSQGALEVQARSCRAQTGALRILALLAPHIAEPSDEKMDAIEARMSREDQAVRAALDGLDGRVPLGDAPTVASARDAYKKFSALRTEILRLSRENTNVRSVSIALDHKRKVDALCQNILEALRQAVTQPMPGEMVKTKGAVFPK